MATRKPPEAARGIQWSAPVLIKKGADGLTVTLPAQVVAALKLGAGDVLNFTELPGGAIEVWMVPKSTYASLDDMGRAPRKKAPGKKAPRKSAKKGGRK